MDATGKKVVLIVEDDAVVVEIYRRKLLQEGYAVSVAQDGLEAMKSLPTIKPDLVVLDLMMPKFNGADVLKFIRTHKEIKGTKVVVFSNAYMNELAQEAAKAGADRNLLKSSSTPKQLLDVIRELLANAGNSGEPQVQVTTPAPAPRPTPQPAPSQPAKGFETATVTRTRQEFLDNAANNLAIIRQLFDNFIRAGNPQSQALRLGDLHHKIHFLASVASVAGCHQIAHLAGALEALLFELQERPKNITPSVIQTINDTVVFLGVLFSHSRELIEQPPISPDTLLVVDDDSLCNRALVHALGRAKLRSTSTMDAFNALKLLRENRYDLILLDYFMPGMDGLELCAKLRQMPEHKNTPIIFITSAADFRQRAQSILQQGDDIITKPIFPIELAVKALMVLMKKQLEKQISAK